MSESIHISPPDEQSICVVCGFCCDGTLFLHATLNPGEKDWLPEWIDQNRFTENGKEFFRLPCHYFSEKCSIYESKRANICSAYLCQLLKDFADGKVTREEALEIIKEAKNIREKLMDKYREVSGNTEKINFRQLQIDLGIVMKSASEEKPLNQDYELLQTHCNIFEALLIKHIRSASDFENMMITSPRDKNEPK